MSRLQAEETSVTLRVQNELFQLQSLLGEQQLSSDPRARIRCVELEANSDEGYGFAVRSVSGLDGGLFVDAIRDGGIAALSHRMAVGDRIMCINQIDTTFISHGSSESESVERISCPFPSQILSWVLAHYMTEDALRLLRAPGPHLLLHLRADVGNAYARLSKSPRSGTIPVNNPAPPTRVFRDVSMLVSV